MSLNAERVSDLSEVKIERILRLFGHSEVGVEELEEGGDLAMKNLSIKEKVVAGAGEVSLDEWLGPANAIEGYVPQHDKIGNSWSNFIAQPNYRKMTNGEMPFASSKFVSNETGKIHSKDYSAVKQDVSKMIVKNIEEPSPAEEKSKPKKPTSLASKVKLKKYSENYRSGDMDLPTSIIVGNDFDNWNASVPVVQDISDMIAKQLENVVLEEKNTRKIRSSSRPSRLKHHKNSKEASFHTENLSVAKARSVDDLNQSTKSSSKLSRPKAKKKATGENNEKLVIQSFAGIRDEGNAIYSNQLTPTEVFPKNVNVVYPEKMAASNYHAVEVHEHKVLSEKKTKSQEKILRSSLKASGSKVGNQSVKWADEKNAVLEDKKIIFQESSKEDYDISERFTSAEACAAALVQAAESVASGKTEVVDAVSEAGILIFPQSQPLQGEKAYNDDIHKLDQGTVKWPKKTVLLDTDLFEVQDSWHDTTPEGFSLHLSPFATMWMALFGWINSSSLAYIYGYDGSSHQKFMLVNGKEYPAKVMLRDGQSLEIRQALDGFICRILPALVQDQMIPVPVSTMEKFMGCLLDTMSFMDAIPSFKIRQWHVIVFLFIEALSVHRLQILSTHFMSRGTQLQQILNAAQIGSEEYEIMKDLILPFGGSADLPI